jgi:hypothetical protein
MNRTFAAAGAVLVALALWFSFGTFNPWALAFVTAGAISALLAALGSEPRPSHPAGGWDAASRAVLGVGVGLGVVSLLLAIPGDRRAAAQHPYVVSLAAVALAAVLTYALPRAPRWVERIRFPVLLACFAGIMLAAMLHDQLPFVDVWVIRQLGAKGLAHGQNPYELVFPNIYSHERFYGPGLIRDGKVIAFPYAPLIALFDVASYVALGDVRWLCILAMLVAAALVARLGGGPTAELAALLVLFQPRTLYVAEVSWTEPLVLATWAGALHLARRWEARASLAPPGWALGAVGLGLLLAVKQYTAILALPLALALPRPGRWKAWAGAVALAAATFVPFAIWNPGELWNDVVVCQFLQPFRRDALSWLAAWSRWQGTTPSAAIGFALAGVVLVLGISRERSLRRAAATGAVAFLVFVLFNKQAFCNYYWLVVGLLASASAFVAPAEVANAPAGDPGGEPPAEPARWNAA